MKCVQEAESNKITRVSDDRASYLVELAGSHSFAKKEAFKIQENPKYAPAVQENTMSNLEKRKKRVR